MNEEVTVQLLIKMLEKQDEMLEKQDKKIEKLDEKVDELIALKNKLIAGGFILSALFGFVWDFFKEFFRNLKG